MSAPWSELEDISAQVEDANEAARGEVSSQRNEDWADIYDDRTPTPAELAADTYDDWQWARNRGTA